MKLSNALLIGTLIFPNVALSQESVQVPPAKISEACQQAREWFNTIQVDLDNIYAEQEAAHQRHNQCNTSACEQNIQTLLHNIQGSLQLHNTLLDIAQGIKEKECPLPPRKIQTPPPFFSQ